MSCKNVYAHTRAWGGGLKQENSRETKIAVVLVYVQWNLVFQSFSVILMKYLTFHVAYLKLYDSAEFLNVNIKDFFFYLN